MAKSILCVFLAAWLVSFAVRGQPAKPLPATEWRGTNGGRVYVIQAAGNDPILSGYCLSGRGSNALSNCRFSYVDNVFRARISGEEIAIQYLHDEGDYILGRMGTNEMRFYR